MGIKIKIFEEESAELLETTMNEFMDKIGRHIQWVGHGKVIHTDVLVRADMLIGVVVYFEPFNSNGPASEKVKPE